MITLDPPTLYKPDWENKRLAAAAVIQDHLMNQNTSRLIFERQTLVLNKIS